ncbi:branched-chain amino acid ABC transporter permease [Modestobacter sp. VKM Ac-2985]|uniref:branched-chain amino acid ABC transporter permease n=1 Tax=Modestobacter sp. VKM Ac-2985 TaxID=3004139 RepID=UPI0022AB98B1|nr:branched-chain amino acid ABC transporter permease [Modestobacter sp. VKM Ac-2985]MCZ2835977.1 branched-chain amino acid ABC transporter permease [Modestobacter sp. VKM Ac-2985]
MSDLLRRLGGLALLVVALALPLVLNDFWLQTGLFVMAAAIGAVGLTLLVGVAGQLSLGHAAFAAIGAYVYAWSTGETTTSVTGGGLPPLLGLALAALVAAGVGAAFSPVAGRLRGIYLGLATLGLVFIVRHLLLNLTDWTGGFTGRSVESFALGGFSFSNRDPDYLAVGGVEFEGLHRLWYLFLLLAVVACWLAGNLRASRTGRAWANVRDSETAAAAMGIGVARAKAAAFVVSSAYAGTAGAMLALAYGRVAPDVFSLTASVDFLVMIVLGGLGSVAGAVVGALFVTALPLVLAEYSSALPFLAAPGSGGLDPSTASRIVYGVAIIAVLVFLRGGLAGAGRRLRHRLGGGGPSGDAGTTDPDTPGPGPAGRTAPASGTTDPSTPDGSHPAAVTHPRSKETTR